jgi:zinc transporter ZupT
MALPDPYVLAFWGLVTFVAPMVMLFVPFLKGRLSENTMHLMLGFSAGLLGGITFIDILPEAFDHAKEVGVSTMYVSGGVAVGLFLLFAVERHMLVNERKRSHVHVENGREIAPLGTLAVSALTIHGIVDGFVIPVGFSGGGQVGLIIALAVALHQIPDSFSAATIALTSGYKRSRIALFVLITALDTPIGIVVGYALLGAGAWMIPFGLGLSAGTFIFVSAADLIPELQHRSSSAWVTVSIVLGFIFVMVLNTWVHV